MWLWWKVLIDTITWKSFSISFAISYPFFSSFPFHLYCDRSKWFYSKLPTLLTEAFPLHKSMEGKINDKWKKIRQIFIPENISCVCEDRRRKKMRKRLLKIYWIVFSTSNVWWDFYSAHKRKSGHFRLSFWLSCGKLYYPWNQRQNGKVFWLEKTIKTE